MLLSCKSERPGTALFYNRSLEDSLECFISHIEEVSNPYGAPTIIDIWLNVEIDESQNRNDTLVFISASYQIGGPPGFQSTSDKTIISYPCAVKGAGWVSGKMCVVKYINNNAFPSIVNEKLLTIPKRDYDFFSHYQGPIYDIRISRCSRLYKLDGNDSVILLEREDGN